MGWSCLNWSWALFGWFGLTGEFGDKKGGQVVGKGEEVWGGKRSWGVKWIWGWCVIKH